MYLLIVLGILFFFYLFLIFNHIEADNFVWWSRVHIPEKLPYKSGQVCHANSDCNLQSEMCYTFPDSTKKCVTRFRDVQHCNPKTGLWTLHKIDDLIYAKCTCLFPYLVTQRNDGSNCEIPIACSPHGILAENRLDLCVCDPGYKSVLDGNIPICEPIKNYKTCPKFTLDSRTNEARRIFTAEYLSQFGDQRQCLKLPCTFNALNGTHLKHGVFDENYGCLCAPEYGNVGIHLEISKYLNQKNGYNACINIYGQEFSTPSSDVELHTHFYIENYLPISFIIYKNIDRNFLIKELSSFVNKNNILIIGESFPFDYLQNILRSGDFYSNKIDVRLIEGKHRYAYGYVQSVKNWTTNCSNIYDKIAENKFDSTFEVVFNLYFQYLICSHDRDKFMINPYRIYTENHRLLKGFDGIKLTLKNEKWFVEVTENDLNYFDYDPLRLRMADYMSNIAPNYYEDIKSIQFREINLNIITKKN